MWEKNLTTMITKNRNIINNKEKYQAAWENALG